MLFRNDIKISITFVFKGFLTFREHTEGAGSSIHFAD